MTAVASLSPLSVDRILRVNYAGEYGAVRIYQAQLLVARLAVPDLVPFLEHTLSHEIRHRDRFRALMGPRSVRVCGALPLWGIGGFALGLLTGILGRSAILACTEAVESVVHRHLDKQLAALGLDDPEVSTTIRDIRIEELEHLEFAEQGAAPDSIVWRVVQSVVSGSTTLLIWLSTYGEALVLQSLLRRHTP
jgi:ubiquinone biosynthesis monooxygenase Coq7